MFVIKEKDNREIDDNGRYHTTLKHGFYSMLKQDGNKDTVSHKVGHIEVCIVAGDKHFEDRLDNFLVEATKLYERIVMGNKKVKTRNEYKIVR